MTEQIIKVTPEQFASVQRMLQREPVFGVIGFDAAQDALRSVGVEPRFGVTYKFEVVQE